MILTNIHVINGVKVILVYLIARYCWIHNSKEKPNQYLLNNKFND